MHKTSDDPKKLIFQIQHRFSPLLKYEYAANRYRLALELILWIISNRSIELYLMKYLQVFCCLGNFKSKTQFILFCTLSKVSQGQALIILSFISFDPKATNAVPINFSWLFSSSFLVSSISRYIDLMRSSYSFEDLLLSKLRMRI